MVFVIDFSSSMNGYLGNQATADPSQPKQTKNQELKRILRKLTQKVYQNSRSQVGFVPFAIGVATQLSDGSRFCTIPWHSNIPITDLSRIPALFAPSPTYNYRDVKDYKRLSELIALNVNIDATLDGILDPIAAENTVSIPMKQVGFYFCDHHDWPEENQPVPLPPPAQQQIIPLTTDIRELKKIEYMKPLGSTFTTAGILAGVKLLHQSPVRKKRLIIISDGDDVEYLHITKQLIAKGMCEKIKRQGKIEMAFIGIEYLPPTNQNDSSVNWRDACVGADHFYTPDTVQSLEDALTHAVLPGTKEEMGRNVPKRH